MKKRRLITVALISAAGVSLFFYKPPPPPSFPPFDLGHISSDTSPLDSNFFYQRIHKKSWRVLARNYRRYIEKEQNFSENRIPKILYHITSDGNEPASASSWKKYHPDWEYRLISTNDNPLDILYQEGGVVIPEKAVCLKPLTPLHAASDFYVGLTPEVHSPHIDKRIIGARPHHPALIAPSLKKAVFRCIENPEYRTVVLPSTFFSENEPASHSIAFFPNPS